MPKHHQAHRVCIVGGGAWGTTAARIVARNAAKPDSIFFEKVMMWVHEETLRDSSAKLSETINKTHVNSKYLPGVVIPANVVAEPNLEAAVFEATLLVLAVPPKYLHRGLFVRIMSKCAPNCRAISLVKGMHFIDSVPHKLSSWFSSELMGMDIAVLMGANVAAEVARDEFCEATIGVSDAAAGEVWSALFNLPTFRVNVVMDATGVELCGALKNIVALGAGFCDGLGCGGNTKASIVRIGLEEMKRFCKTYFTVSTATFFESCGVADVITSCYGGRTSACAKAFVTEYDGAKGYGKSWEEIAAELYDGQELDDVKQLQAVIDCLVKGGMLERFPLFSAINQIAFHSAPPATITALPERKAWRQKTNHAWRAALAVIGGMLVLLLAIYGAATAMYFHQQSQLPPPPPPKSGWGFGR